MKNLLFFFFCISITQVCFSQNSDRIFISAALSEEGYRVEVEDGLYVFNLYNDFTIETTFVPKGDSVQKESHAVVLKEYEAFSTISETTDFINLSSAGISIHIVKSPFQIQYTYKGNALISEKNGYSKIEDGEAIQFNLDNSEVLYGGGSRALGMNIGYNCIIVRIMVMKRIAS